MGDGRREATARDIRKALTLSQGGWDLIGLVAVMLWLSL